MAKVLSSFRQPLETVAGTRYHVRACGRQRSDGLWEGWIEFDPDGRSAALRTRRETTQPTLAALEYWASGLTTVYLEGALARAVDAQTGAEAPAAVDTPAYDAPAPDRAAVLDPFSIYARSEGELRVRLGAVSARHLQAILRVHRLVEDDVDLDALGEPELIALIVAAVQSRTAA